MTNAAIGLNNYATGQNSRYPELWRGCVGAWAMCLGPTGTRLFDFSGRQNWGTLTNMDAATDWVVSGGQYALDFDGVNDYVNLPVQSQFVTGTTSYSVCMWVNIAQATFDNTVKMLLDCAGGDANTNNGFFIAIDDRATTGNATNGIKADFKGTASTTQLLANNIFSYDGWHHIAINVVNGFRPFCWINGRSVTNTLGLAPDNAQPYLRSTRPIFLGAISDTNTLNFQTQVDDLRLYNRALSPAEIRLLASKRGIAYERRSRRRVNEQAAAAALNAIYATRQMQLIGGGLL